MKRLCLIVSVLGLQACDFDQRLGTDVATGGTGGGATTGTTGEGGATSSVGSGGGTGPCVPGSVIECYSGRSGTEGVGTCEAGTKTCSEDGSGYGPCVGEVLPAFEVCSTADDEDCNGATPPCPNGSVWAKSFGDGDTQATNGVAVDASGALIVVGDMVGAADFGGGSLVSAGGWDAFVTKLDSSGAHAWSKRFGDGLAQHASSVAVDGSGNVIVAGLFEGTIDLGGGPLTSAGGVDIYAAKLDPAGNHIWSKRFGDATSQQDYGAGGHVAVDAAGNVVLAGWFNGSVDFGGGTLVGSGHDGVGSGGDIYVAKLDAAGNHLWSKRYGDFDASVQIGDWANGLAVDGPGNVLVAGHFNGTVDFGGGALTNASSNSAFVLKLDSAGNHVWSKRFGELSAGATAVAVDTDGGVLFTGRYNTSIDLGGGELTDPYLAMFVAKLDSQGNHVWSKPFGGASGSEQTNDIAIDASGNLAITGRFEGELDLTGLGAASLHASGTDEHVFVVKLDASGTHLWSDNYGEPGQYMWQDKFGNAIAFDGAGYLALVGGFFDKVDFGTGTLTSAGGSDAFVAKLAP